MASRQLTILHFNDVYNIDVSSKQEPVGGAARFVHAVKQQKQAIQQETGHEPLVLFSGDCFNPSLMSVSTLGKQMVPVLNALGLAAACVGNHDFDWGLNSFV
jgi:5'-nucleotidase